MATVGEVAIDLRDLIPYGELPKVSDTERFEYPLLERISSLVARSVVEAHGELQRVEADTARFAELIAEVTAPADMTELALAEDLEILDLIIFMRKGGVVDPEVADSPLFQLFQELYPTDELVHERIAFIRTNPPSLVMHGKLAAIRAMEFRGAELLDLGATEVPAAASRERAEEWNARRLKLPDGEVLDFRISVEGAEFMLRTDRVHAVLHKHIRSLLDAKSIEIPDAAVRRAIERMLLSPRAPQMEMPAPPEPREV